MRLVVNHSAGGNALGWAGGSRTGGFSRNLLVVPWVCMGGWVGLGCGGWDGRGGSGWGAGVRLALGATELPLILLVCGFA